MRRIQDIYREIDAVKAETIQIIENRGLYPAEEYQSMLLRQHAREKALKSELTTNHFLYAKDKTNHLLGGCYAASSCHRHFGGYVMDDRKILFPNL